FSTLAWAAATMRRIAVEHLLDPPRINFDLQATPFELQQRGRSAVAVLPTPVERRRHLGECHIGKAHCTPRSATQLGGKAHVLVSELTNAPVTAMDCFRNRRPRCLVRPKILHGVFHNSRMKKARIAITLSTWRVGSMSDRAKRRCGHG